jgi:hypothetical protein
MLFSFKKAFHERWHPLSSTRQGVSRESTEEMMHDTCSIPIVEGLSSQSAGATRINPGIRDGEFGSTAAWTPRVVDKKNLTDKIPACLLAVQNGTANGGQSSTRGTHRDGIHPWSGGEGCL